jgi:ATP synthase protein I
MRLIGVGWYVGLCIFLGVWGGLWLDNKLNTKPVFIMVGLIIGVIAAFYGIYRMLLPLIRDRQDEENS